MIVEEKYLVKYFIPNNIKGSPMDRKREDSFMGLLYKGTISLYKAWHALIYIESFIESQRFNGEKKTQ